LPWPNSGESYIISIENDESLGRTQKDIEHLSNLIISTTPPMFSIGWTIGWEAGKMISSNDWYREHIRTKIQDALGVKRDEYPRYDNIDKLFENE
jgi:hypothetical protein